MTPTETYIVTGATGGIGRAIVEGLISQGASHVILACRNIAKANLMIESLEAGTTTLEARQLDLMDSTSVCRFAEKIVAEQFQIKALFNNAGIMPGGVTLSPDRHEAATQTNFLSTMMLTEQLLPAITPGAAIIFTTSMTRRIARFRPDWAERAISHHGRFTTYGRSKKMLTAYALLLSQRLAPAGIRVNCSDPGIVDSAIITMGNRIIDRLSALLFRPLIYTPKQGATPALAAMKSPLTAHIFTLHSFHPIPASYAAPLPASIISATLSSTSAK